MRLTHLIIIAVLAGTASGCGDGGPAQQSAAPAAKPAAPKGPAAADAAAFLERMDEEGRAIYRESAAAQWVQSTYITEDTQLLAAKASERALALQNRFVEESRTFDGLRLPAGDRRALDLLRLNSTAAPKDPKRLAEFTEIGSRMEAVYGSGTWCRDPGNPETCRNEDELKRIMARSRDYDELLDAWRGWRTISPPFRADYQRFVDLSNEGARDLGFADTAELWRSRYDMTAEEFEAETDRLWEQVLPLYSELQCYVRDRVERKYGTERMLPGGLIPAHLVGNMWAQQWGEIYDLVEPYPGVTGPDVTAELEKQKWDPVRITRSAESFYESMGLQSLPETFWQRSLLERPRDRNVVCHASAWDMDLHGDVRIKQCIEPTKESLMTVYHELGHVYYFLAYNHLPLIFQGGAHDGFHEAIGDSLMMSLTPSYFAKIGLAAKTGGSEKALINEQMRIALDKIAFLPFGKLVDQWRWDVFTGRTPPSEYNAAWWKLRQKYQGVGSPIDRSEQDFDPGAKYHIPANVPYMRYFLAHILQFQFYRALCDASGHAGALHECSFAGSTGAGRRLAAMMALGQGVPWPDALEKLTGARQMDASAIVEYFQPLMQWLNERNAGQACGWEAPG